MTDYRTELQRLVQAYDEHGGKWHDEDVQALHRAVEAARTALAQPEPDASSSMTQSEQQAVIGWVDQHINTNKAIRSWRDPTRGGLLMAEVHTVQPGTRARAALAQQDSTTDTP